VRGTSVDGAAGEVGVYSDAGPDETEADGIEVDEKEVVENGLVETDAE